MTIAELRAARAKKVDAFAALVATMNADGYVDKPEDTKSYDTLKGEVAAFDARIKREEESNTLKASTAVAVVERGRVETLAARPRKVAPLKYIKGENADERAYRAGNIFLASMYGNEKAAGWCRENGIILRALSEGVQSAGGVLVPEELENEIIILRNSYGLARRELEIVPMGRDTITTPKLVSGLTMYFTGEGIAAPASQPVWTNVRLTAKKASVLTLYSSELDEDAIMSIGDILTREIAYAFAVGEDNCLFSGDGTSTYGGMTGLRKIFNDGVVAGTSTLAGGVDAVSGHDTMAEMDANDIAKCMGALPQYVYEIGTPKFYMSQTMWANVFERLIGASGGVTKDQASGRTIHQYNGYDVELTPAMLAPATTTTDTSDVAMWLFGDLNLSVSMGDRRGLTLSRSTEYKFAEDQIAIKGTERFDINAHNTGDATTAGSIVAMIGE